MKNLPESPNLEYLRREAKLLRAKHASQDCSVSDIIGHYDTSMHGLTPSQLFARKFSIIDAQRIVARQYSFSSWAKLKQFVSYANSRDTSVFEGALGAEIVRRNKHTDELIAICRSTKNNHKEVEAFYEYGLKNADFLSPVYDQFGWPGPDIIGRDGTDACFMLAASATLNGPFQARTAALLHDSVEVGKAFGACYASIIDRYLALSGKKTIYGSMSDIDDHGKLELSMNVVDPENLDKRRALVGYEPFLVHKEYLRKQNEGDEPNPERWKYHQNDIAVRGRYIEAA